MGPRCQYSMAASGPPEDHTAARGAVCESERVAARGEKGAEIVRAAMVTEVKRTANWVRKKIITLFWKIFLDSRAHVDNYGERDRTSNDGSHCTGRSCSCRRATQVAVRQPRRVPKTNCCRFRLLKALAKSIA